MKRFILPLLTATTLLGSALNANTDIQAVKVLKKQWSELSTEWERVYGYECAGDSYRHSVATKILEFQAIVTTLNDALSVQDESFEAQDIQRLKNAIDAFVIKNDIVRWAIRPHAILKKQWDELCNEWQMSTDRGRVAQKIAEFKIVVDALADAIERAQSKYSSEAEWMRRFQADIQFMMIENRVLHS